jgi:LPXTG-motif cell wall-anchored protein
MDRHSRGLRIAIATLLAMGGIALAVFGAMPSASAGSEVDPADYIDEDGNFDLEAYNCEVLGQCGDVSAGEAGPSCGASATAAGGTATVTLPGVAPGSDVLITVQSDPVVVYDGPVSSDPAVISFTVPSGLAAGTHTIIATGVDANGGTLEFTCPEFQVLGSTLPRTGSDPGMMVGIGGALLVLGGATYYAARRRKGAMVA